MVTGNRPGAPECDGRIGVPERYAAELERPAQELDARQATKASAYRERRSL